MGSRPTSWAARGFWAKPPHTTGVHEPEPSPPAEPDFDALCANQAAVEALQDFVCLMYDADGMFSVFGLMQPKQIQDCARAARSALFQLWEAAMVTRPAEEDDATPCPDCHGEKGKYLFVTRPGGCGGLEWLRCTTCAGTGRVVKKETPR